MVFRLICLFGLLSCLQGCFVAGQSPFYDPDSGVAFASDGTNFEFLGDTLTLVQSESATRFNLVDFKDNGTSENAFVDAFVVPFDLERGHYILQALSADRTVYSYFLLLDQLDGLSIVSVRTDANIEAMSGINATQSDFGSTFEALNKPALEALFRYALASADRYTLLAVTPDKPLLIHERKTANVTSDDNARSDGNLIVVDEMSGRKILLGTHFSSALGRDVFGVHFLGANDELQMMIDSDDDVPSIRLYNDGEQRVEVSSGDVTTLSISHGDFTVSSEVTSRGSATLSGSSNCFEDTGQGPDNRCFITVFDTEEGFLMSSILEDDELTLGYFLNSEGKSTVLPADAGNAGSGFSNSDVINGLSLALDGYCAVFGCKE